ncbi:MAG TPA: hypothetical protein PL188_08490, partial [Candidatus Cloacimonadota bacterium]|nr:hypothetical protein [Candidatus Cloacimonadota bacterium]
ICNTFLSSGDSTALIGIKEHQAGISSKLDYLSTVFTANLIHSIKKLHENACDDLHSVVSLTVCFLSDSCESGDVQIQGCPLRLMNYRQGFLTR